MGQGWTAVRVSKAGGGEGFGAERVSGLEMMSFLRTLDVQGRGHGVRSLEFRDFQPGSAPPTLWTLLPSRSHPAVSVLLLQPLPLTSSSLFWGP